MNTGAPSGTVRIRRRRSRSLACMHPSEAAAPIVAGDCVPCTAIRSSPFQVVGRSGWWADSAMAQQPYSRSRAAHRKLVGDGETAGRRRVIGCSDPDPNALERTIPVAHRQRARRAVDLERDVGGAEPRPRGGDPGRTGVRPLGHDHLKPLPAPLQHADHARPAELRAPPDRADGAATRRRAQRRAPVHAAPWSSARVRPARPAATPTARPRASRSPPAAAARRRPAARRRHRSPRA